MLLVALFLPHIVLSTEFNCAAPQTHGSFTRMTDCTLPGQISVSGSMEVTGRDNLTTITAASRQRHFYVTTQRLTLKWLTLTGGSLGAGAGGSILVQGVGTLVVYSSLLTKNKVDGVCRSGAWSGGGAIAGLFGAKIELRHTNITYNTMRGGYNPSVGSGGGIFIMSGSLFISNCMIAYNSASSSCGGIACTESAACQINDETIVALNAAVPGNDPGICCSNGATCSTDGSCYNMLPCPPGSFGPGWMTQNNMGAQPSEDSCKKCLAGKASPYTGKNDYTTCQECLPGKFSKEDGAPRCNDCPQNKIAKSSGSTSCTSCGGTPECSGRGKCTSAINGCRCIKGSGWSSDSNCASCQPTWLNNDGKCDKCAKGYTMSKSDECIRSPEECRKGYFRNARTGKCEAMTVTVIIYFVSIIGGTLTFLGVVYKAYTFHRLKREGKLNPEINDCKAFVAVFFYGDAGKHIIVNNTMEATLLGEEDIDEGDHRVSFVEMRDRRASMDAFLTDARLSHLADKLQRDGIYGTQDLIEMEDDDLEAAGFRRAEKKRFLKAREKLREERANDGSAAEEATGEDR
jgi:hypothetical protein